MNQIDEILNLLRDHKRRIGHLEYLEPASVAFSGGTLTSNLTLDDGVGNSPLLQFVGGTNDDTISMQLKDDAVAGKSDLTVKLCGTTIDSRLNIRDSNNAFQHYFTAFGQVVHNEAGNDADFRVEAVGQTHALFVQGSDGNIGFGTSNPDAKFSTQAPAGSGDNLMGSYKNSSGDTRFTFLYNATSIIYIIGDRSSSPLFTIGESSGRVGVGLIPTANMAGLSIEAGLLTLKERATPTADVNYGKLYTKNDNVLYFQDGAGVEKSFLPLSGGKITGNVILDDGAGDSPHLQFIGGSNDDTASLWLSDSAGAGLSDFVVRLPGDTIASQLKILNASSVLQHFFGATGEVVLNEVGNDADFRVEGSGNTHLLFGDAGNNNVNINSGAVSAHYDLLLGGDGVLCVKETTTPIATGSYGKLYCKSANKLYFQDGAGVEHEMAFAPF